jgi:hypothetical protein
MGAVDTGAADMEAADIAAADLPAVGLTVADLAGAVSAAAEVAEMACALAASALALGTGPTRAIILAIPMEGAGAGFARHIGVTSTSAIEPFDRAHNSPFVSKIDGALIRRSGQGDGGRGHGHRDQSDLTVLLITMMHTVRTVRAGKGAGCCSG